MRGFEMKKAEKMLNALLVGWYDGLEQPFDMNMGMSYDDETRQMLWDFGSIAGQRARRIKIAILGRL